MFRLLTSRVSKGVIGQPTISAFHGSSALRDKTFVRRHIGPSEADQAKMLQRCGYSDMATLISDVIPARIRLGRELDLPEAISEAEMLAKLSQMMDQNVVARSYIGLGFHNTHTPTPIMRNVFENPGWYTAYTPYQPEISQGRLESLLNFQTIVSELTGLPIANASLLDEGTAAAEAMGLAVRRTRKRVFLVDASCHPTTLAVLKARAQGLEVEVQVEDLFGSQFSLEQLADGKYAGVLVQYPNTYGSLNAEKISKLATFCKEKNVILALATDLLALTLMKSPGALGATIALGSAQRFGVPLGFGGPSAAFFATTTELVRLVPGRIIGASVDDQGNRGLRLTLQTREQHIRRDKATSNVCTAQALLANMAAFYAVYHGPKGLTDIATKLHQQTLNLAATLAKFGHKILNQGQVFDTIHIQPNCTVEEIRRAAESKLINLRYLDNDTIVIALDETVTDTDLKDLASIFTDSRNLIDSDKGSQLSITDCEAARRTESFLLQPVFNSYHSETSLMRYMKTLENKDISLVHSTIPLGSCTMKLNSASELIPLSWPKVNRIHPYAPRNQVKGYLQLLSELEKYLAEITGYDKVCLTPNSGAQGEFAGLRAISRYLESIEQAHRKICLIPVTAHGTNPASAAMAGFQVKPVKATKIGTIDLTDLEKQIARFKEQLGAIMITYPSTSGVFDQEVDEICARIHEAGAQVYLDGANMNAQVGLCRPGDYGSDVSHLNLHKTFCIPHGGGGPGVGPIGVKAHLAPFLPNHPMGPTTALPNENTSVTDSLAICNTPFGSASLLPISWAYIRLMGPEGLRLASEVAMLSANYMMKRLSQVYHAKYTNELGLCAHEFIIDGTDFKKQQVSVVDIAKRLMDFGFHSPTMSWPIESSLMVEPTESESLEECDRLCEALLQIREEINAIDQGSITYEDSPLKNAPHTIEKLLADNWTLPYNRMEAAYPGKWQREHYHGKAQQKMWPSVGRIDDKYGDTHIVCTCPPVDSYDEYD